MLQKSAKLTWNIVLTMLLFVPVLNAKSQEAEQSIPKKVWRINKPTVSLHKKIITRQLARNKYERIGIVVAASAVIVALGAYSLGGLTNFSNKAASTVPIAEQTIKENTRITGELVKEVASFKKQNYATAEVLHRIEKLFGGEYPDLVQQVKNTIAMQQASTPKRYSSWMWEWAKRIGATTRDNFAVLLLMGGLPGPINKMFGFWGRKLEELGQRVYHDSDFHWFVSTQTHTMQYFNDLERAAELLPLANDDEEREHQEEAIYWSSSMLTKQLARMIAFMEYQAEKLKVLHTGCSIKMQASTRYVYRHVDQFSTKLQALLVDKTKHAEIPAYIKSFRATLRSEEETFCTNERAALYNISDTTK